LDHHGISGSKKPVNESWRFNEKLFLPVIPSHLPICAFLTDRSFILSGWHHQETQQIKLICNNLRLDECFGLEAIPYPFPGNP
jgi:hypothetical protein